MGTQTELDKVQNLYLLQMDLWKVLDGKVRSPENIKTARKQLREYAALLKEVDWRYMGGEDVFETLEKIRSDAEKKLRVYSAKSTGTKKVGKAQASKKKVMTKRKSGHVKKTIRARSGKRVVKKAVKKPTKKVATKKKVAVKRKAKK